MCALAVAQSGQMGRVRMAAPQCFSRLCLTVALALASPGVAFAEDGGMAFPDPDPDARPVDCRLKTDVCPSVGHGCHLKWEERMEDGSWVDAMAPVRCNRSIQVCGKEIWCTCPTPGHAQDCVHASHE